jgi:hypothetical protein
MAKLRAKDKKFTKVSSVFENSDVISY